MTEMNLEEILRANPHITKEEIEKMQAFLMAVKSFGNAGQNKPKTVFGGRRASVGESTDVKAIQLRIRHRR